MFWADLRRKAVRTADQILVHPVSRVTLRSQSPVTTVRRARDGRQRGAEDQVAARVASALESSAPRPMRVVRAPVLPAPPRRPGPWFLDARPRRRVSACFQKRHVCRACNCCKKLARTHTSPSRACVRRVRTHFSCAIFQKGKVPWVVPSVLECSLAENLRATSPLQPSR